MKKCFGLVLLLLILVAVLAPSASAAEYDPHPHSYFGHCVCCGLVEDHDCEHIEVWTALEGDLNFGMLDSGYYYLTGDVTAVSETDQFMGRVTKNSDGS